MPKQIFKYSTFLHFLVGFFVLDLHAQDTKIRFFAHTGGFFSHQRDTSKFAFNVGGLDLLLTSQITDRLSVLSETFIGAKSTGVNFLDYNIQRLFVNYNVHDYLNIKLGKMLNPYGYWNSTYNYGFVLMPTIEKPTIVQDRDQAGQLNTLSVGLQLDADNIGSKKFGYKLFINNGNSGTDITSYRLGKSITAQIKFEPIENLKFYVTLANDVIQTKLFASILGPQNTTLASSNFRFPEINQNIASMGMAYFNPDKKLEYATEYFYINSSEPNFSYHTHAGYAYLGYKLHKKFVPYTTFNTNYTNNSISSFALTNKTYLGIGARYLFNSLAVLKLEYRFGNVETVDRNSINIFDITAIQKNTFIENKVSLQLSVAF